MNSATTQPSLLKVFMILWATASAIALLVQPTVGHAAGFGLAAVTPGGMALMLLRSDKQKAIKTASVVTAACMALVLIGTLKP
jgi:hypothetical protein